jgi:tRNA dimethylallyltransferase
MSDRVEARPPVALVGTTASGKSKLALCVAEEESRIEILSADSMSVYRGMDIGTAKPSGADQLAVHHHLIDLVAAHEEFGVAQFQLAARSALDDIAARDGQALLVGGTGLYVRSVVDGLELPGQWPALAGELNDRAGQPGGLDALYTELVRVDPVGAARIEPQNQRRIIRALEVTLGAGRPFSSFGPGLGTYSPTSWRVVGLRFEPEVVDRRIEGRFAEWLQLGLVDEIRSLVANPDGMGRTARQAVGYRELLEHVETGAPLAECVNAAIRRTKTLARRQWAWFRRDPRIRWVEPDEDPVAVLHTALRSKELSGARE